MANEAALKIKAALDPANADIEKLKAKLVSIQDANRSAAAAAKAFAKEHNAHMREAQHAVHLLGDEIGVKIPRHLRGVIANLPGFATALSLAFAPAAAFALFEILEKIVEKVGELKDELQGYTKEIKEMMKEAVEASNRALTHFSSIPLGKSLLGQTNEEIGKLEQQKAALEKIRQTANSIMVVDDFGRQVTENTGDFYAANAKINEIDKQLTALYKRRTEQEQTFKDLEDKDHEDRKKHIEQLNKLYEKQAQARQGALAKIKEILTPMETADQTAAQKLELKYRNLAEQINQFYRDGKISLDESLKAQRILWQSYFNDLHQMEQEAQSQLVAEFAKGATQQIQQVLSIASAEVKGPILEIKNLYHDTAQLITRDFKENVVDALHAATMGAVSFADAMKQMAASIISDIAKIIEEMLVMQAVQAIVGFFIPRGGGLGRTINPVGVDVTGTQIPMHASGGFFPADMPFIAGEEGPEMILPSTSGRVAPNYSLRGNSQQGPTILIDARGADAGVEQRVMRAAKLFHDQAVLKAVTIVGEQRRRRT